MDARGGRILEFLKENSHLDLEVPDIAFNVKKSEKTVEAALKKYQQKGLVTARQNEFGRVYWYALPSAPITRVLKTEELLPESSGDEPGADADEAVDLFSLPKKETKSATAAEETEGKPAGTTRRKSRTVKPVAGKPATKPPETDAMEPTFEPAEPANDVSAGENGFNDGDPVATGKGRSSGTLMNAVVLVVAAVALIVGLSANGRTGRILKQLATVEKSIPKDVVGTADLQTVKEQVAGMAALEKKVTTLTATVDSLSNEIVKINEARAKPRRRTTRRRR